MLPCAPTDIACGGYVNRLGAIHFMKKIFITKDLTLSTKCDIFLSKQTTVSRMNLENWTPMFANKPVFFIRIILNRLLFKVKESGKNSVAVFSFLTPDF